jgi:hypothetical protein
VEILVKSGSPVKPRVSQFDTVNADVCTPSELKPLCPNIGPPGNVREKLAIAHQFELSYRRNMQTLRAVQPDDVLVVGFECNAT